MAAKKAKQTTKYNSKDKNPAAVRDIGIKFKTTQTNKRFLAQDIQHTNPAERETCAVAHTITPPNPSIKLPGVSIPIPTPGVASQASPLTIPNLAGGRRQTLKPAAKSSPPKKTAKPAAAKKPATAKKPAAKSAAKKKTAKPVAKKKTKKKGR